MKSLYDRITNRLFKSNINALSNEELLQEISDDLADMLADALYKLKTELRDEK